MGSRYSRRLQLKVGPWVDRRALYWNRRAQAQDTAGGCSSRKDPGLTGVLSTGTDEHGLKIQQATVAQGSHPIEDNLKCRHSVVKRQLLSNLVTRYGKYFITLHCLNI